MRKVIALILTTLSMLILSPLTASASTIEPCNYEDGSGQTLCYWDGETMGNGQGLSYVVDNGQITYGYDHAAETATEYADQPIIETVNPLPVLPAPTTAPVVTDTYTVTTYEAPAQPVYTTQPVAEPVAYVAPAQDMSGTAWELFDATHAADLLPTTASTVTYVGHSTTAFELSADTITVWDNHGNHYLFTVTN